MNPYRFLCLLMFGFVSMTGAFATAGTPSTKARQLYKEGLALRSNGQLPAAISRFSAAIYLYQPFTDAYLQLGDIYRIQQQPEKAVTQYQAVLECQPGHIYALRGLAAVYYDQHAYEQALTYALQVRAQGVSGESLRIGQCYAALHDSMSAQDALKMACAEMPGNSEPPCLLARLYASGGNFAASIYYFQQAIRIDSTQSQLYYEAGKIYFNINDYTKAIQYYEHAAALGLPLHTAYHYNLAMACLKLEQTAKGIKMLEVALSLHPEDIPAIYLLAHTYYTRQEFKEAIVQWNLLLSLQPENAFALFMLGKSYIGAGNVDKGIALCDRALSANSSVPASM
ncbi:tetratricopeptide repeat protein [Chitinophaga costaii]|nr:tetratricopeptide repeat protein [Chitinophaga costaii]